MKLSEAIKVGAGLTKQITNSYLVEDFSTGKVWGACALGAAWVGVNGVDGGFESLTGKIEELWPEIDQDRSHSHPVTEVHGQAIYEIVTSLNDNHAWSREKIAEWLEGEGL